MREQTEPSSISHNSLVLQGFKVSALFAISKPIADIAHNYMLSTEEIFTCFGRLFMKTSPNEPTQTLQTGKTRVGILLVDKKRC
ncbi:hypothetical protein ASPWEDRAFT_700817 [Aspergillus wentii DTO 134E9]|uniref:Uncharacterized protein n=1 Tax=Aspergillus wentii DTO 134E9 TaxID=1073089 RepID=A0A1L9R5E2_ASPWE|nr:uncharacterized protein ASPWEDRAFT_700817 [Aspergillus wentii DTO 134E9]OJJ30130.1 hypothetical protein ASPWEDRAFT_700817 [Aspergillus wentii DTO 134E9]